jgi:DNA-binding winged helix-turn-helix (wHTH) protein/cytochrome c-type biogenesis protein CcmH/NrfG
VGSVGLIRFGAFELHLETGELRRKGRAVKLSPKPLQLLVLLARSPGRLVTREAIRRALWGPDTFVDFEHALNFCVREVREALGDSARKPRFIETLPRRGYRFLAQTTEVPLEIKPADAASEATQLEAYACYTRARKSLGMAAKGALEEAWQDFERALALNPDYALAHSGLGAVYGLRSLNRRNPDELGAAQAHLERALALDPELAEPYPWLCYILMRQNQLARALEAGHRGVELQPDLVQAHYFLGLAYLVAGETGHARYNDATRHLLNATRADPHWQPAWFVLSYAALLTGRYAEAEAYASRLVEMNRTPKGMPFLGGEIVLASVKLRRGEPDAARAFALDFLERTASSDHMYRDGMSAAAACVLGDVELRHGKPAGALAAYRRAWHTLQEHPRIMAYGRISVRAQSGLAAAYVAMGERNRAGELLSRAIETARENEAIEHSAAAASLSEMYWSVSTACARLGDTARALAMVQCAVNGGWRDAAWMENDPELSPLRHDPVFRQLIETVRAEVAPSEMPAARSIALST